MARTLIQYIVIANAFEDTSPDRETFDRLRKAELELAKASNYSFSRLLNYSSHSDQRDTDYWFDGAKHGVVSVSSTVDRAG